MRLRRVDALLEPVDHDALLLELFVEPSRQLPEFLHAAADLLNHHVESLVVVLDLHHHLALVVRDLFLTRSVTAVAATSSTVATTTTSIATTSASSSVATTSASREEAAAFECANGGCDARAVERGPTAGPGRAVPGSRELLDELELRHVLLQDLFPDLELRWRELGLRTKDSKRHVRSVSAWHPCEPIVIALMDLFFLDLLLVARLELVDVLSDQADVFADLLLPPDGFARVLVALHLRLGVLQVLRTPRPYASI